MEEKNYEISDELKAKIEQILKRIEEGNSEKKEYDFEIPNTINKLNYVSDKALELAIEMLSIGEFSIQSTSNKRQQIIIKNSLFSLCDNKLDEDELLKRIQTEPDKVLVRKEKREGNRFLVEDAEALYNYFYGDVCRNCKFEKCPKALAAYVLYLYNQNELADALIEREEFRSNHTKLSPYFDFEWDTKVGVTEINDDDYAFCEELVNRNIVDMANVTDKEGLMFIYSQISCDEYAIINNQISQIPDTTGRKYGNIQRHFSRDPFICSDYFCKLSCCPYEVAGYIYYMKKSGRQAELDEQRKYYHEHQEEQDKKIKEKFEQRIKSIEDKKRDKLEGLDDYKDAIENLDSLRVILGSEKQRSLHIIVSGNNIKEREDFVLKIVGALKNVEKVKNARYYSMQQFSKIYSHMENEYIEDEKSIEARKKAKESQRPMPEPYAKRDINGVRYKGNDLFYYAQFEPNTLYVLDNISEFINDYRDTKDITGISINRKQIRHTIDLLTSMNKNEYVIISGNEEEVEKLLDIDPRFNFVYQDSVYKLPELTLNQIFDLFLQGIEPELIEEFRKNEEKVRNDFNEYVSFAKKFMPFDDRGLANYISLYVNSKGKFEFPQNIYKKESLDESLKNIIGLNKVKEKVKEFEKFTMFQIKAKANNIKLSAFNMHMVFTGNPGTGKTTIARIMAKMLYNLGIIKENKLTEVSRKDLVGMYIGQTAPKTQEVIDKAMGGVLFIDEAYALASNKGATGDFGHEAVATLIKAMEDNKDRLVVIFAGYKNEMQEFINSNPGISSRVGYTFDFEDYEPDELDKIFELKVNASNLKLSDGAMDKIHSIMNYFHSVENFGNGRFVDKVFAETLLKHAMNLKDDAIDLISVEDIPEIKDIANTILNGNNMIDVDRITESSIKKTAIHEVGHATVRYVLFEDPNIVKITINAEGAGTLGYVMNKNTSRPYTQSKEYLCNEIKVCLAGLCSEQVFIGFNENGCSSDLEKATSIAKSMVTDYGMSSLGLAKITNPGAEVEKMVLEETNKIINECYEQTIKIISNNKAKMQNVIDYLVDKKEINEEEFIKEFNR